MQKNSQLSPHWLGMEAPRYTSYPTAHHFSSKVNAEIYSEWMKKIAPTAEVSVYVHIPFCRELCWFCGCHTKITNHYAPITRYVGALLQEISLVKQLKDKRGKFINIHFGGGSPSILEGEDLRAIMLAIGELFAEKPTGEVAIELDPRTTTSENIKLYAELGFNRISLGSQDFDEKVQVAINRVQPYELVANVVQQLRDAGLNQINCDLIYGLPLQTLDGFAKTLAQTLQLNPSRLALFSYAHVPSVKKHQSLIDDKMLPSDVEKLAIYEMSYKMLTDAGYVAIGIDHFAKPDDPLAVAMHNRTLRRNFQGYVTDTTDTLIGVGVSSISQFPQGYAQSTTNSLDYRTAVENGKLPTLRGYEFCGDDLIRKRVIDDLMCFLSVDLMKIIKQFKLADDYFLREIEMLKKPEYQEVASCNSGFIQVSDKHKMAARVVATLFDEYRLLATGRYSKVS
jgi:oxygen-independent coproporphyrinogen-3 oxidase